VVLGGSDVELCEDRDYGFGIDDGPRENIQDVLNRWRQFSGRFKLYSETGAKYIGPGGFEANKNVEDHEIDEEYSSEDLGSDVEGDDKFSKFKSDDMCKNFRYKLGMEFCSLKEAKQAIREHAVLNGRQVEFVKIDKVRVRVVCKKRCGFIILVSKVGSCHSFRVKTLVDVHQCARVFNNKNANIELVSKVVMDKFRNVGNMSTNQIMDDIKRSGNWIVVWAGGDKFEVTQGFTIEKFVVDLKQLSSTCWFWELVSIPCRHVVTAINYRLEQTENYVHRFYKKEAYQRCYGEQISPINGQPLWPKTNSQQILPPSYKTHAGRPRKLRRREADETVSHSKISRRNLKMKCTRCDQFSHNIRGCKNQPKKHAGVILFYARFDLHLIVINC